MEQTAPICWPLREKNTVFQLASSSSSSSLSTLTVAAAAQHPNVQCRGSTYYLFINMLMCQHINVTILKDSNHLLVFRQKRIENRYC